jgi:VanZ family protein
MAVMFGFSTDAFSADNTGSRLHWLLTLLFPAISEATYESVHFFIRRAAHFSEYALLALLSYRAFRAGSTVKWQWRWAWRSFVLIAVWALLDEWHQTFTTQRSGSIYDSLLDIAGGAAALLGVWIVNRQSL